MHTQGKNADLGYGVTDSFSFSIGLGHDGDNNCTNGVNIMSTVLPGGTGALKWSSCSRHVLQGAPRSNARACAMHSYPVAGRENFPRQNLIDTISESVSREKKIERQ